MSQVRLALRDQGFEFCDEDESDGAASLATEHARATADALRHEQLISAGIAASTTDSPEQAIGEACKSPCTLELLRTGFNPLKTEHVRSLVGDRACMHAPQLTRCGMSSWSLPALLQAPPIVGAGHR